MPTPIDFHDVTEADLFEWELILRREGTLPPEVQRLMIECLRRRPVTA